MSTIRVAAMGVQATETILVLMECSHCGPLGISDDAEDAFSTGTRHLQAHGVEEIEEEEA